MTQPVMERALPTASCFVCDEEVAGSGVPLLVGHTLHSRTDLPTKIGQLLGEEFLVVVQTEDVLCRRCEVLLNHLDQLEVEVVVVKHQLTTFLQTKYQLDDSQQPPQELSDVTSGDYSAVSYDTTAHTGINKDQSQQQSEMKYEEENEVQGKNIQESLDSSEVDPLNENIHCEDKVNVEIILEKSKPPKLVERIVNNCTCASCGFNATSLSELSLHMATCDQRSQFACSMCKQSFSSNKGIQRHIMQQHLSMWICHFCNVKFSEEQEYTSHLGTHLTNSSGHSRLLQAKQSKGDDDESITAAQASSQIRQYYKCTICEYRTTDKQSFDEHIHSHVVLKLFKCEECGNRFRNQELLMKHLKMCPQPVSSRCSICEVEFANVSDMLDHMKTHNTFEENCSASDDVLEILGVQNTLSNDLGLMSCEKQSVEHVKDNELICPPSEDVFQCSICFKTFMSKLQYDDHVKAHNRKFLLPPDNVELSEKASDEKGNIAREAHSSTGIKYESKVGRSLEEIIKSVNSDKKSTIEISEKSNLESSMFSCFCGASFSDKSLYEKHKIKEKHILNNDVLKEAQCVINDSSIQIMSLLNVDSVQAYESHLMQTFENVSVNENGLVNVISCENGGTSPEPLNGIQYIFDVGTGENITVVDSEEALDTVPSKDFENQSETLASLEIKSVEDNRTNLGEVRKKTYLCTVCGYRSTDFMKLKIHLKKHKEKKSNSSLIREKFSPQKKIMLHFKNEKSSGILICMHCFNKFDDRQALHQHMLDCHSTERYSCSVCDQRFPSRKALKVHEDTHSDKLLYKCDFCSQRFSKEKQLKRHRDMIHRDPHCRYCGKEILKAQTLKNHELRHAREANNFECDICKRVFKTKTGLRHHVATHTGEYKFCCDYCGRGFMSRMMMEEHRSMHTKEERYICDVCGRKFSFQSTYWIHRKWHDTPYPYNCNFCGRMFRHSSLLAVHKRKHTGERPYKCPQCPLTFPVGGTLKRHMILHTGVYPFNCDRCKRGFTTKHKYATHLAKVHSDYDLLNSKSLQNDYKMVVRDERTVKQEGDVIWHVQADGTEQNILNLKLAEIPESESSNRATKDGLQCAVSNNMLVDSIIPTRVVEIVLDEGSQAMATVTLAEHGNIMPELWYQQ